jgi:hypothetical protein
MVAPLLLVAVLPLQVQVLEQLLVQGLVQVQDRAPLLLPLVPRADESDRDLSVASCRNEPVCEVGLQT